ncbi:MAG: trypsin-like peptidase domain-containing protein [Planctomycetaceae bacterium]|nr:trypsin-like peptidase domain-containing protein [Planctomycetaceae bacterium]
MHVVALCLVVAALAAAEPEAVVLEFTAPDRCPPCQQIAPLVSRLKRENYPIQIVNADENAFVCQQHRIHSIPTFVLMIAGREVDRIEGKPPESELRRMCERARLANVSAATPAENRQPKPEVAKPEISEAKADTANPKSDEPVIRAKHDDSANLPPSNSIDPLHVCPRIRVKDSLGVNFGTGTVIDSHEGRTTILTCGHIFRKLDDKSVIEVDVFHGAKHETFVGTVLRYDLEADVGLLWIPTTRTLPVAAVAGLPTAPTVGQHVFSVGCSGGDPPSKLQHRVTALNRYLGPDNVECTGVPIQGRSGGGLFDTAGRLIGVCIAADQRDQRGLYSGLKPIHELLNKAKLSYLYPQAEPRPQTEALAARDVTKKPTKSLSTAIAEEPVFDQNESEPTSNAAASPFASSKHSIESDIPSLAELTAAALQATPGNAREAAANFDPQNESEVVCIIRPLNNPRSVSRVVIINRASSKFLSQLSGELEQQAKPTSAVIREAKYAVPSSVTATPRQYRRTR